MQPEPTPDSSGSLALWPYIEKNGIPDREPPEDKIARLVNRLKRLKLARMLDVLYLSRNGKATASEIACLGFPEDIADVRRRHEQKRGNAISHQCASIRQECRERDREERQQPRAEPARRADAAGERPEIDQRQDQPDPKRRPVIDHSNGPGCVPGMAAQIA